MGNEGRPPKQDRTAYGVPSPLPYTTTNRPLAVPQHTPYPADPTATEHDLAYAQTGYSDSGAHAQVPQTGQTGYAETGYAQTGYAQTGYAQTADGQLGYAQSRPSTGSNATLGTAHTGFSSAGDSGFHQPLSSAPGELVLSPGAHIHQYELIRELGRGGMGVVYAARDLRLGRRVAVKFLQRASPAVAARFLIEARATAQCNHENIVIIHEVSQIGEMPFMVLEFLEGTELRKQMGAFNAGARMPASRVIELMLPVARALARAHQLGIVHRDLKPENVFVTSSGVVKVLDFGIAKAVDQGEQQTARPTRMHGAPMAPVTNAGGLVGTLPYMSPEQLGRDTIDHRSDLWTFGVMMFEMLTGYHPVQPLTTENVMLMAGGDDPMPAPLQWNPDLDPQLSRIVELCLRKNKNERMPNAAELVRRLEELLPGRRSRQLAEGESPYPGLNAFQETDADRFFGRAHDVAKMVARVREHPLTGVVGPSGVGKSSFVRAGVGPALKASGETWEVVTIRPGRQPIVALANVAHKLTTRSGQVLGQLAEDAQLITRLRQEPGLLGQILRQRARTFSTNILLFVDQFEELYTLVPDAAERRAFTAALAGVADDTASPLRAIVSMRSDFLDRIGEDPQFLDDLSRGLVFLQPPDRRGLRDALVQPVEMLGHRFESQEIIDDMLNALGNSAGALPLLQFAASKLWDARDRDRKLLTLASYRAIGGISGALAAHADEVIGNLNAPARKLTQRIFRHLVTPERTRAIAELSDLEQLSADPQESIRLIDQLVAARLLVVQPRGDGGGGTVEIVHESLIERWPTLRRWLDEDHEDAAYLAQLSSAAKQWDVKGRPSGLLWRGDALDEAKRWYTLRPRELPPREQAFLDAAFALALRGKRVKRAAVVVVMMMLAAVAIGASVMLVKVQAAETEAQANAERANVEMKKATDALAQMQEKERQRLAAEEQRMKAEADRAKAESDKLAVETQAKAQQEMSREELEKQNEKLIAQAAELSNTMKKLEAAMTEAKRAKTEVERINAEQKKRIADLEEKQKQAGKFSTQLKDK